MIRPATAVDAIAIAAIYNHYIRNTVVTFEEETLTAAQIAVRIEKVQKAGLPWLVAEQQGGVIGYVYAARWHERSAFRHTVEVTVYLAHDVVAKGWGSRLYAALFAELKNISVHVAIGVISLPNAASVALHEKFGMKKMGHLEAVGYKFGQWLDIGYWQLMLGESALLKDD